MTESSRLFSQLKVIVRHGIRELSADFVVIFVHLILGARGLLFWSVPSPFDGRGLRERVCYFPMFAPYICFVQYLLSSASPHLSEMRD
jgi:hypothetical protein